MYISAIYQIKATELENNTKSCKKQKKDTEKGRLSGTIEGNRIIRFVDCYDITTDIITAS